MLRSASDYRLQERKLAEAWCEASHMPTRTEVDELQRTVTELRRQLRALQRAKSPPAEALSADAAPPRRARAARAPRPRNDRAVQPAPERTHHAAVKKSPAAQALAEFSDFNLKMARGQQMLQRIKDEHVQIATADKDVVFRQDKTTLYHYKPVAEAHDRRAGAGRLRPDRPLHHDRPAGRPLDAAQPAGARRRRLRGRLGQPDAQRPLADLRRLRRRLPERLRRVHLPRARAAGHQPAGHLRRRRVLALLRGAVPGAREEPDPHHHAGRLPPGPGRGPREPRLHQPVDAQPDGRGHRPV